MCASCVKNYTGFVKLSAKLFENTGHMHVILAYEYVHDNGFAPITTNTCLIS